jgi:tetratricopeptide (TPR) repeat protein
MPNQQDGSNLRSALDLLGQMENQVGNIAYNRPAESAASAGADEELRQLREELLSADQRGYEQLAAFTQALEDLKLAIPSLIDESVNTRFLEIEDTFHRNVKEIHSRSIDAFTQSVQSKIGQRIAALETNLSVHIEAMGQLREHYLKTDRNVQRLMTGLDRLTAELFRLSTSASPTIPRTIFAAPSARQDRAERAERQQQARAAAESPKANSGANASPDSGFDADDTMAADNPPRTKRVKRRRGFRYSSILAPVTVLVILGMIGMVFWSIRSSGNLFTPRTKDTSNVEAPLTGIAAKLELAAGYTSEKNYAKAESTYREILRTDPNNREAIKELASVLFRQQRYEESAAILKTLPPE